MGRVVRMTILKLLPSAIIYSLCCLGLNCLPMGDRMFGQAFLFAFFFCFLWMILLRLFDPEDNPRVFLMLPVRAESLSFTAWIKAVGVPSFLLMTVTGLYLALTYRSDGIELHARRIVASVLWIEFTQVSLALMFPFASSKNERTRLFANLLVVIVLFGPYLMMAAVNQFAKDGSAWKALLPDQPMGLGVLAVTSTVGLLATFLLRQHLFMARVNPSADFSVSPSKRAQAPRFLTRRDGVGWMLTPPLPATFASMAAYAAMYCAIMLWIMPASHGAYGICFIMTTISGTRFWNRNWLATTRVLRVLPSRKDREALAATLLTPLILCVPLAMMAFTYCIRGMTGWGSERVQPGRFFCMLPCFLGGSIVLAALDMGDVWPSQLVRNIAMPVAAGITVVLYVELAGDSDTILDSHLLWFGCLAVSVGMVLTWFLVHRALDDSAFYKKGTNE